MGCWKIKDALRIWNQILKIKTWIKTKKWRIMEQDIWFDEWKKYQDKRNRLYTINVK